jgi:hypothetical protein
MKKNEEKSNDSFFGFSVGKFDIFDSSASNGGE